jgi:hypothetical protein
VVAEVIWRCESTNNWYPVDYDPNAILLTTFPPGDVKEVAITHYKVVSTKDVYMRFMLHLNAGLDDDLLQDAIELLEAK